MNRLRHVREFTALVSLGDTLHFARAAEKMGVSNATFSRLIVRLEDLIGARVARRTSRRVELTEVGEVIYRELVDLDRRINVAIDKAELAKSGKVGDVRIGYGMVSVNSTLPALLRRFRSEAPRVEIALLALRIEQQFAALAAGELDLSFSTALPESDQLEWVQLTSHRLCAVMRHDDPLASKAGLTAKDLEDRDFVMGEVNRWTILNPPIAEFLRKAGLDRNRIRRSGDFESFCAIVSVGLGIGFFTEFSSVMRRSDLVTRPVRELDARIEEHLIWRRTNSNPAAARIIDIVKAEFAD